MINAKPEIRCLDYWPEGIPPGKLFAYKAEIAAGQITKRTAIVNRRTGAVTVDYLSTIPQDWIRHEMAEISAAWEGMST